MNNAITDYLFNLRNVEEKGIYFILSEDKTEYLSYHDLYINAKKMAQYLKDTPYEYMLIQIESIKDFICTVWACLFAKKTLFPLKYAESENDLDIVKHILKVSSSTGIICDSKSIINSLGIEDEKIISSDMLVNHQAEIDFDEQVEAGPEDIIMIQFSSGSTGNPKGIITKNKNLLANVCTMISRFNIDKRDSSSTKKVLDWIPLTHNMGLIVGHFMTLMRGIDEYIMPTKLFVINPMLFLEKMSEYQITATHCPNFAMEILSKLSMNYTKELDLSRLTVFSVGSEYVSVKTCQMFTKCMARFHMPETAVQPGYGLTEATVVVSNALDRVIHYRNLNRDKLSIGDAIEEIAEDDPRCAAFVEVGSCMECIDVKIIDNNGKSLGDGYVGKILLKGSTVVDGYYLGDNQFKSLEKDEEGWFDTGDLGFLVDGFLTIIGRNKDVIIINGKNYYPTDFENLITNNYLSLKRNVVIVGKENNATGKNEIYCFVKTEKIDEQFAELVEEINELVIQKIKYRLKCIVPVPAFPVTGSGKIRRFKLLELYQNNAFEDNIEELAKVQSTMVKQTADKKVSMSKELEGISKKLLEKAQELVSNDGLTIFDNLFDAGFNSVLLTQFLNYINVTYKIELRIQHLINCKTVFDIATEIWNRTNNQAEEHNTTEKVQITEQFAANDDIAIIGVDLVTADAKNVDEFWANLCNGKVSVNDFPKERANDAIAALNKIGVEASEDDFGKAAYLEEVDKFDCKFFKMVPKVATMIDPEQRMLLETSWKAFEDAGYTPEKLKGTKTGVFVAYTTMPFVNTYYDYSRFIMECEEDIGAIAMPGNLNAIMGRRISQYYDLHGPCMLIDTACSSSVMAIHTACTSIRNHECDMAFVGTVKMDLFPLKSHKVGIESEDGYTRTFDDRASGTGRGEGCAAIILKPYHKALEDHDNIYAVIKGSAINNDGNSIGLTVPNMEAQKEVLVDAWTRAGISPTDLTFLEAHGTATKIGDPIEVQAITDAAALFTDQKKFCPIGSVKSNIGHLDHAAGMFGVIKSMLALRNKQLPPSMNYEKGNSSIDFENAPVYVNTELKALDTDKDLFCGISSFGFAGTNCHVVLKGENKKETADIDKTFVYKLSANSMSSLENMLSAQLGFVTNTTESIQDICYTADTCRSDLKFRCAVIVKDKQDLIDKLKFMLDNTGSSDASQNIYFSEQPVEQDEEDTSLERICKEYISQEDVDWNALFEGVDVQKIHMPGYIFDKKRCWLAF